MRDYRFAFANEDETRTGFEHGNYSSDERAIEVAREHLKEYAWVSVHEGRRFVARLERGKDG